MKSNNPNIHCLNIFNLVRQFPVKVCSGQHRIQILQQTGTSVDKQVDSPCYACRTHHGKYSLQQHFVVLHCTVLHLTVTDNLFSIRLACVDTGHDLGSFLFFSRTFTKQKAHDAFWWTVKQIWKRKTNCRLPRETSIRNTNRAEQNDREELSRFQNGL